MIMQKPSTRSARVRTGFTLVELLIVIAIISLLAAIIYPAFEQARQNAMRASCQSNLKQLMLGVIQYTQDNDEYAPCGLYDGAANQSWPWHMGMGWAGQIYPWVRNPGLYVCPEETQKPSGTNYPVSYAYNGNIVYGPKGTAVESPMSEMNQPSMTICFTEGHSPSGASYNFTVPGGDVSSPDCNGLFFENSGVNSGNEYCEAGALSNTGFICGADQEDTTQGTVPTAGWHFGGSNFAFLDGHVKWLMGDEVSPGENAESGNPLTPNSALVQTTSGYAAGTSGTFSNGVHPAGTYSIT